MGETETKRETDGDELQKSNQSNGCGRNNNWRLFIVFYSFTVFKGFLSLHSSFFFNFP